MKNNVLVQFVPLSLWEQISGTIGNTEADTYIRILGKDGVTLSELDELQKGSMMILGAFCALLPVIGIANVFSNTLGFLRQRKREFARYASVGMTPEGMRKMFAIFPVLSRPRML